MFHIHTQDSKIPWWYLFESDHAIRNDLPPCFRANKDVPPDLDIGIAIQASEGYAVNDAVVNPAERGTALAAKLQAETMLTHKGGQQVFTGEPPEFICIHLRIGRSLGTERLPAPRAVARACIAKLARQLVGNFAAETLARYCHSPALDLVTAECSSNHYFTNVPAVYAGQSTLTGQKQH
jgi:hypothetical protein